MTSGGVGGARGGVGVTSGGVGVARGGVGVTSGGVGVARGVVVVKLVILSRAFISCSNT